MKKKGNGLLVQNELMDWFVIRHTSIMHFTIMFLFSTVRTEKISWVSFTLTPIQIWSQLLGKTKTLLASVFQRALAQSGSGTDHRAPWVHDRHQRFSSWAESGFSYRWRGRADSRIVRSGEVVYPLFKFLKFIFYFCPISVTVYVTPKVLNYIVGWWPEPDANKFSNLF